MFIKYILLFTSLLLFSAVKAQNKKNAKGDDTAFKYVEQMPEAGFNFLEYVNKNFRYSDTTFVSRIVVKFIVNEDGTISNCQVLKGKEIEKEIIDLICHMPKWKPGKHNGKVVKVWFTLPIIFEPQN